MEKNNGIKKNNNIHDNFFKSMFSVKENLEDLLLGTLPKEVLQGLKPETLTYDPTEYVDKELAPYFKDISCNMQYGYTNIKVSLLYEHKSYPNKNIHLQLLRYILNVWENQVANKQPLTPVITMVFYHGKPKWTDSGFVQVPEELKRFVPLFDYALFDTKDIEDHAIIQHFKRPSVKVAVWFMKRNADIYDFIMNNLELSREIFGQTADANPNIKEEFMLYLQRVTGVEPHKIDKLMQTLWQEKQHPYVSALKAFEQSGVSKEQRRIVINMIKKGYSDTQISEVTDLSTEEIQKVRKEDL